MRRPGPAECRADAAVHLCSLVLGIAGCVGLAVAAAERTSIGERVSLFVYGIGLMAMLVCSALYHLHGDEVRRPFLRRLDHAAIFSMIAGTYTAILARAASDGRAGPMLATVWLLAAAGIAIKLLALRIPEWLSVVIYLGLGWTILLGPQEILAAMSSLRLWFLAVGGLFYTVGVLFYCWNNLPYHTAIWHGFVTCGAGCQYVAIVAANSH